MEGIKQEHDEFKKEQPPEMVLTSFNIGGASKTEHDEIVSYRGLAETARLLGQRDATCLMQENLQQEEQMAKTLEQIGQHLGQQMIASNMGSQMGQTTSQQHMPS